MVLITLTIPNNPYRRVLCYILARGLRLSKKEVLRHKEKRMKDGESQCSRCLRTGKLLEEKKQEIDLKDKFMRSNS